MLFIIRQFYPYERELIWGNILRKILYIESIALLYVIWYNTIIIRVNN